MGKRGVVASRIRRFGSEEVKSSALLTAAALTFFFFFVSSSFFVRDWRGHKRAAAVVASSHHGYLKALIPQLRSPLPASFLPSSLPSSLPPYLFPLFLPSLFPPLLPSLFPPFLHPLFPPFPPPPPPPSFWNGDAVGFFSCVRTLLFPSSRVFFLPPSYLSYLSLNRFFVKIDAESLPYPVSDVDKLQTLDSVSYSDLRCVCGGGRMPKVPPECFCPASVSCGVVAVNWRFWP